MRLTETLEIAAAARIRHPWDNQSRFPYVMTTDFLVTTENGLAARTVKEKRELSELRILEKFEIERRYWAGCGISWKIVTEDQIDIAKAKNILWLKAGNPEEEWFAEKSLMRECEELFYELYNHEDIPFSEITDLVEGYAGTGPGTAMAVFKGLVLSGRIGIDMSRPICLQDPRRS